MKPELRFETKKMQTAALGGESCLPDLQGEDILQNSLKFDLDEEDEVYGGYGRRESAYPYRQHNCYTRELEEKDVQTAVLENDFLKAVFLPESGGRLWELWDKTTGKNLLYTNDVLRYSNLATRNAWFSGGVEWNIGIIGHCPFTTDKLYTARLVNEDGAPVLRMYEYERIRKVTYQMDFWLGEKDRFLQCRMRIVNENEQVVPMYWWSNIAVPEFEGGRIIVPAEKAFTYVKGLVKKVDIPYVNGIDITDYKKIEYSVDYFFDIPDDETKYVANVDRNGFGLLQVSTDRLRSRKLFSWGRKEGSDRWQEFLTEDAGRYLEIQAGLGKTQYGCIPMAPQTAWEWMEQYGPVQIPVEDMGKSHKERSGNLSLRIREAKIREKMTDTLKATKTMAKQPAELVIAGSGYGAMAKRGPWTGHLEFRLESESLKKWAEFFNGAALHMPDADVAPDEFFIDEDNLEFMENALKENEENWYAHYHLGLGYYAKGDFEKAEAELKKSYEFKKNAWACHALACVCLRKGRKAEGTDYMVEGINMQKTEVSYLKDGFKILTLCGAYEKLCICYENLETEIQKVGKLRFYYISALYELGFDEKAYELLEADGGLMMDDIREGENSISKLWTELRKNLDGEAGQIPHKYNFEAV